MIYAIILNYNSSRESIDLYRSLIDLKRTNLKILVIDNNSADDDKSELRRKIPKESLIQNHNNLGYAGGNNIGVRKALAAGAEHLWILNPDIRITEDALDILLESIKSDPNLAAVGPRIRQIENPDLIFTDGERIIFDEECKTFHLNYNLPGSQVPKKTNFNIDYIDGSSILINSKALNAIGEFSELYFLYFEETDWCLRAKKQDWKLAVNSNAEVYNITSEKGPTFHYYMSRNRLLLCKKFHPDFSSVAIFHFRKLMWEFINRVTGKSYLKPYYFYRFKGFLTGLFESKK